MISGFKRGEEEDIDGDSEMWWIVRHYFIQITSSSAPAAPIASFIPIVYWGQLHSSIMIPGY